MSLQQPRGLGGASLPIHTSSLCPVIGPTSFLPAHLAKLLPKQIFTWLKKGPSPPLPCISPGTPPILGRNKRHGSSTWQPDPVGISLAVAQLQAWLYADLSWPSLCPPSQICDTSSNSYWKLGPNRHVDTLGSLITSHIFKMKHLKYLSKKKLVGPRDTNFLLMIREK